MSLISVIIPVYNVEKYLSKCVDSIINQTYTELEIILIDDGSTDSSGKICDSYCNLDKRIKVVHQNNRGLSYARNIGIELATGKYISFIDSDDWIENNMFEKLYNLADLYDADIVQGDYIRVFNELDNKKIHIKEEFNILNSEEMLLNLYNKEVMIKNIVVWNKLYKAKLFETLRFPVGKIHEDEAIIYKLYNSSNIIIDSNMVIYYYRQRQNSIIHKKISLKNLDLIDILEERRMYFKQHNMKLLVKKTDAYMYSILINYYIEVLSKNINDYDMIKQLRLIMIRKYFRFVFNNEISISGKIGFTIGILNKRIFYKIINIKKF